MTTKSYDLPESVSEAVELLARYGPDILIMAGGTLTMPLINEGISRPERVLGLRRAGLNYLRASENGLAIGATTTLNQIERSAALPVLREAAGSIGGWAVRNMATIGGNLFAPPPGGDFAATLLALDAKVNIVSKNGTRTLPLEEFYKGFMQNALEPGEILTEIFIPTTKGRTAFYKFGRRHASTPTIVTVAANLTFDNGTIVDARLVLNGVGPFPFRSRRAENSLIGETLNAKTIESAATLAGEDCQPFTDPVASEWYRKKITPVIVSRTLEKILH